MQQLYGVFRDANAVREYDEARSLVRQHVISGHASDFISAKRASTATSEQSVLRMNIMGISTGPHN